MYLIILICFNMSLLFSYFHCKKNDTEDFFPSQDQFQLLFEFR